MFTKTTAKLTCFHTEPGSDHAEKTTPAELDLPFQLSAVARVQSGIRTL